MKKITRREALKTAAAVAALVDIPGVGGSSVHRRNSDFKKVVLGYAHTAGAEYLKPGTDWHRFGNEYYATPPRLSDDQAGVIRFVVEWGVTGIESRIHLNARSRFERNTSDGLSACIHDQLNPRPKPTIEEESKQFGLWEYIDEIGAIGRSYARKRGELWMKESEEYAKKHPGQPKRHRQAFSLFHVIANEQIEEAKAYASRIASRPVFPVS